MLTAEAVRERVDAVSDPEIPTVTIGQLGMVERVDVSGTDVSVELLPTFAGCPALDVIREDVERAVRELAPDARVTVRFVMTTPWTTARIQPGAHAGLREYGISPPILQIGSKPQPVTCPYCGSTDNEEQGAFGPTPCRSIRYCRACRNPFEGFKTKG